MKFFYVVSEENNLLDKDNKRLHVILKFFSRNRLTIATFRHKNKQIRLKCIHLLIMTSFQLQTAETFFRQIGKTIKAHISANKVIDEQDSFIDLFANFPSNERFLKVSEHFFGSSWCVSLELFLAYRHSKNAQPFSSKPL
jgi:hypothetical protein